MVESNTHVLRDCKWASEVWSNFRFEGAKVGSHVSFRDWFGWIMDHGNKEMLELFGVIAWQIWGARNELIFDKTSTPADLCFKKAVDHLAEFRKANLKAPIEGRSRRNAKWEPPSADHIKVNVDATINERDDRIGLGMVVRDASGSVLLAASQSKWPFISVERAELEALLWAVDFIKDRGWHHVVMEGDAQYVIHALQRKSNRSFHNQIIVDNILASVSAIDHLSFSFCYREANSVAHRLAKWALSSVCSNVWHDGGPSWITDVVLSELIY